MPYRQKLSLNKLDRCLGSINSIILDRGTLKLQIANFFKLFDMFLSPEFGNDLPSSNGESR